MKFRDELAALEGVRTASRIVYSFFSSLSLWQSWFVRRLGCQVVTV